MIRSLSIAKTGLDAQQTQLDVVANNLANVGTTGFKRSRAVFEDLMYQNLRQTRRPDFGPDPHAFRPATGHRRARRRHRANSHPGQPDQDRQPRKTWPSMATAFSRC